MYPTTPDFLKSTPKQLLRRFFVPKPDPEPSDPDPEPSDPDPGGPDPSDPDPDPSDRRSTRKWLGSRILARTLASLRRYWPEPTFANIG